MSATANAAGKTQAQIAVYLRFYYQSRHEIAVRRFDKQVSRERAVGRLVTELGRHTDQINPLSQFYFWNQTRRSIALSPYAILSRVARVVSPFLDHDLYDFLAALAPEMIFDRSFHAETIWASYPRFADIPISRKASDLPPEKRPFGGFARQLFGYLLGTRSSGFSLLGKRYVLARLVRCLLEPRFEIASVWLMTRVLYLAQRGALSNERRSSELR